MKKYDGVSSINKASRLQNLESINYFQNNEQGLSIFKFFSSSYEWISCNVSKRAKWNYANKCTYNCAFLFCEASHVDGLTSELRSHVRLYKTEFHFINEMWLA